jgi:hypothetical protein
MDERQHNDEAFSDEWEFEPDESGGGLMSAFLMAVALAILIASFVWFVIRLDPLTDDFIGGDPAAPAATQAPEEE